MDEMDAAVTEELTGQLRSALERLESEDRTNYYQYLAESDALLKATISYFETGDRPVLPEGGSVEFGIIPYWLKNPDKIPHHDLLPSRVRKILEDLEKYGLVPPPTITDDDYNCLLAAIQAGTAVAEDGTLFGEAPYEQLNTNWLQAVVNDVLTKLYGKAGFGGEEPDPLPLKGSSGGTIKIAIFGDWGTGEADALDVVKAARALDPDYMIHLGDVYYTGSPHKLDQGLYWAMNNERVKLVDVWPPEQPPGTSFTLNSNHEMYCGARGYFYDALGSDVFAAQKGKSYFLLQNDDWQIFGLDSAYSSTATLNMEGALNDEQIGYVQKHRDTSKRVIFLTHHTGYDVTGTQIVKTGTGSLWKDATNALGGAPPDYWYWGHIHDGVIYKPLVEGRVTCHRRCLGHASLPYGAPWVLTRPGSMPPFGPSDYIDSVEFFAGTPVKPSLPAGQVKNGFALVTLNGRELSEAMYDNDGTRTWPSG